MFTLQVSLLTSQHNPLANCCHALSLASKLLLISLVMHHTLAYETISNNGKTYAYEVEEQATKRAYKKKALYFRNFDLLSNDT